MKARMRRAAERKEVPQLVKAGIVEDATEHLTDRLRDALDKSMALMLGDDFELYVVHRDEYFVRMVVAPPMPKLGQEGVIPPANEEVFPVQTFRYASLYPAHVMVEMLADVFLYMTSVCKDWLGPYVLHIKQRPEMRLLDSGQWCGEFSMAVTGEKRRGS